MCRERAADRIASLKADETHEIETHEQGQAESQLRSSSIILVPARAPDVRKKLKRFLDFFPSRQCPRESKAIEDHSFHSTGRSTQVGRMQCAGENAAAPISLRQVYDHFSSVLLDYVRALLSRAGGLGRHSHDAADVTQETWIAAQAAARELATYSGEEIEGWLKKTARNKLLHLLRERRTGRRPGGRLLYLEEVKDLQEPLSRDPPPDEESLRKEEEALLRAAMGGVKGRRAKVLSLVVVRGMPIGKAAAMLRISRFTARREYRRAIEELRRGYLASKG